MPIDIDSQSEISSKDIQIQMQSRADTVSVAAGSEISIGHVVKEDEFDEPTNTTETPTISDLRSKSSGKSVRIANDVKSAGNIQLPLNNAEKPKRREPLWYSRSEPLWFDTSECIDAIDDIDTLRRHPGIPSPSVGGALLTPDTEHARAAFRYHSSTRSTKLMSTRPNGDTIRQAAGVWEELNRMITEKGKEKMSVYSFSTAANLDSASELLAQHDSWRSDTSDINNWKIQSNVSPTDIHNELRNTIKLTVLGELKSADVKKRGDLRDLSWQDSRLGEDAFGKEQMSSQDEDMFITNFGIDRSTIYRLTVAYNNMNRSSQTRGLNGEQLAQGLRISQFWADLIVESFGSKGLLSLPTFIYVSNLLRKCPTQRFLIHKATFLARAITKTSDTDQQCDPKNIREFLERSCVRMRLSVCKEVMDSGIRILLHTFEKYGKTGRITNLDVVMFLVSWPELIEDISVGLVNDSDSESEYEFLRNLDMRLFLEMIAFSCKFDSTVVHTWATILQENGVWETKDLQLLSKDDWRAMGLPILVYRTIANKLLMELPPDVNILKPSSPRSLIRMCPEPRFIIAPMFLIGFPIYTCHDIGSELLDVYGPGIWLARGAAGIIILLSMGILWWVSYHTISSFSRLSRGYFHANTHNVETHMMYGYFLLGASVVHAIAWVWGFYHTANQSSQTAWNAIDTRINDKWTSPPSQLDLHLSLPGVTGWIMVFCLLVMGWTAYTPNRKKRFNLFFNVHHLYIVFFVCFIFHGQARYATSFPKSPLLVAPTILIFIFDKIYSCFHKCKKRAVTVVQEASSAKTIRLDVRVPRPNLERHLGKWAWIKIPSISRLEWHPFTIANADHENMIFQIQDSGDWTHELAMRAKNNPESLSSAYIEGPVGCLGTKFHKFKHMILVGSGVGVTPYASVLDWCEKRIRKRNQPFHIENLHFIWMLREQEALEWFGEIVQSLGRVWDGFRVTIYLTSRRKTDLSALGYRMLEIALKNQKFKLFAENPTRFEIGRPDFDEILFQYKNRHVNPEEQVGVFFCGNKIVSSKIKNATEQQSDPKRCVFQYFPEFFT